MIQLRIILLCILAHNVVYTANNPTISAFYPCILEKKYPDLRNDALTISLNSKRKIKKAYKGDLSQLTKIMTPQAIQTVILDLKKNNLTVTHLVKAYINHAKQDAYEGTLSLYNIKKQNFDKFLVNFKKERTSERNSTSEGAITFEDKTITEDHQILIKSIFNKRKNHRPLAVTKKSNARSGALATTFATIERDDFLFGITITVRDFNLNLNPQLYHRLKDRALACGVFLHEKVHFEKMHAYFEIKLKMEFPQLKQDPLTKIVDALELQADFHYMQYFSEALKMKKALLELRSKEKAIIASNILSLHYAEWFEKRKDRYPLTPQTPKSKLFLF
jgi:hypothetical protein